MNLRRRLRRYVPRSRWTKLSIGLLVCLSFLLAAEGALRSAGVRPAYTGREALGWRMTPSLVDDAFRAPGGQPFAVRTNGDGLRTPYGRERQPGARRVMVFGDSTVFGWGVDDGGSVAEGLEAALDARAPTEVINAGQPGYSSWQAAALYLDLAEAYAPDAAVFFLPQHDRNRVPVSDREALEGADSALARARVWMATQSRLFEFARAYLLALPERQVVLPHERAAASRVDRVSDSDRSHAFSLVLDDAEKRDTRVFFGLLPHQAELSGNPGPPNPLEAWALAFGRDTAFLDARSACASIGIAALLPGDPGHLTAEGNHMAGASIADEIATAMGW